ncbi:Hypothetical predicted protein [Octopus vulgaris]|nr:Hypothetical predicted protein [Octopus vulgaris]
MNDGSACVVIDRLFSNYKARGHTIMEQVKMEQDTGESDKSSDEDTESSGSEEDSSEIDEEESERRRAECLEDMATLEHQFSALKERLYEERVKQVDEKLEEIRAGKAQDYWRPLAQLEENMTIRIQVAGILKELRLQSIQCKFESEEVAARQNMESDKIILYDTVKQELEDRIRRLEEDRHNIDISSDLWNESQSLRRGKKKQDPLNPERRRKPVTVTGPYIVYMLRDVDIIEDWTHIKKALKQQSQKRKSEF